MTVDIKYNHLIANQELKEVEGSANDSSLVEVNIDTKSKFGFYGEEIADHIIWFRLEFSDYNWFSINKQLLDTFEFSESLNYDLSYHLGDSWIQDEVILFDLSKELSDNFNLNEEVNYDVSIVKADTFSFSEQSYFSFYKESSDSFGFSESSKYDVTKVNIDTFGLSEILSKTLSTYLTTEIVNVRESLTVQNQDYFDPLFANGGYVGTASYV